MAGVFHWRGGWGRVRLEGREALGMTIWIVSLPGRPESCFAPWRLARGVELLEQKGCRRLLAPCPAAPGFGVIHTRSLWQAMAGPLALSALRGQGLDPAASTVAVEADRLTRPLLRCCRFLAGRVRSIALDPGTQALVGWQLERDYGLPAAHDGAQVTLSFLPGQSTAQRFCLGEADPVIPGFRLTLPGLEPPPGCREEALLAAALEQGRLPLEQVAVAASFP